MLPYWWYFIQYSWGTGQSNGFWSTGYCSPNKHWFLGIAKDKPCFSQTDPLNFHVIVKWWILLHCLCLYGYILVLIMLIAKEFVFRPLKIDCVFCINALVQFSRLEWKKMHTHLPTSSCITTKIIRMGFACSADCRLARFLHDKMTGNI